MFASVKYFKGRLCPSITGIFIGPIDKWEQFLKMDSPVLQEHLHDIDTCGIASIPMDNLRDKVNSFVMANPKHIGTIPVNYLMS